MGREAIDVGTTQLSEDEVEKLIDGISQAEWPGNSYSLLSRNCNHFSVELIGKLLSIPAPGYINRIAGVGAKVSCILPPELVAGADRAPVGPGEAGIR
jgi:hypothetical protein